MHVPAVSRQPRQPGSSYVLPVRAQAATLHVPLTSKTRRREGCPASPDFSPLISQPALLYPGSPTSCPQETGIGVCWKRGETMDDFRPAFRLSSSVAHTSNTLPDEMRAAVPGTQAVLCLWPYSNATFETEQGLMGFLGTKAFSCPRFLVLRI